MGLLLSKLPGDMVEEAGFTPIMASVQRLETALEEERARCATLASQLAAHIAVSEEKERVLKVQLAESQARVEHLEQELAATRQELAATRQELAATRQDLAVTRQDLGATQRKLDGVCAALELRDWIGASHKRVLRAVTGWDSYDARKRGVTTLPELVRARGDLEASYPDVYRRLDRLTSRLGPVVDAFGEELREGNALAHPVPGGARMSEAEFRASAATALVPHLNASLIWAANAAADDRAFWD